MTAITITYRQGNILMGMVTSTLPEKINDDLKFAWDVRATFDRNARQLFKAMKKVSPGFRARPVMIPVFGDTDNWKKNPLKVMKVPDGTGGMREIELPGQEESKYSVIDAERPIELELNAQASDAIGVILLRLCHPDSKNQKGEPVCLSPADQEDIVWPIAEQLCIVPWLEEKIGISKGQEIKVQYTPRADKPALPAPPEQGGKS